MPHQKGIKSVAQNRKAWHDYFVEEKYECGLALFGTALETFGWTLPCCFWGKVTIGS